MARKKKRKFSKDGSLHVTDEKFNSASHLAAAIFSLLGMVLLIVRASVYGNPWHIVSFSIYGTSLFLVFLSSSLHHGVEASPKIEEILRLIDYLVIFPLIAGTYTPLCLVLKRDIYGWSVFGVVWGLTVIGILIKVFVPKIPKWVTNVIYISMGWVGAILVFLLYSIIHWYGIGLIALGGLFYTIGAFIFYVEKPNPLPGKFGFHEIWHIFVILGALSHFMFIYFFVASYRG